MQRVVSPTGEACRSSSGRARRRRGPTSTHAHASGPAPPELPQQRLTWSRFRGLNE